MKLFTEKAKAFLAEYPSNGNDILKKLTPIELPSDEEIEEYLNGKYFSDKMYREYFKLGSKWMKQQILNQNK